MLNQSLLTSERNSWRTPKELFDDLNQIRKFKLDAAASRNIFQTQKSYSIKENGLESSWLNPTFLNPPFSVSKLDKSLHTVKNEKGEIIKTPVVHKWVKKASEEAEKGNESVLLIAARVGTSYWQKYVFPKATLVCFLNKRLHYSNSEKGATFDSAIVIYTAERKLNKKVLDSWDMLKKKYGYCFTPT